MILNDTEEKISRKNTGPVNNIMGTISWAYAGGFFSDCARSPRTVCLPQDIIFKSKKQNAVTKSSAYAEYRPTSQNTCELIWVRHIMD